VGNAVKPSRLANFRQNHEKYIQKCTGKFEKSEKNFAKGSQENWNQEQRAALQAAIQRDLDTSKQFKQFQHQRQSKMKEMREHDCHAPPFDLREVDQVRDKHTPDQFKSTLARLNKDQVESMTTLDSLYDEYVQELKPE